MLSLSRSNGDSTMLRAIWRWLFGTPDQDRTLEHNLHYVYRGVNDPLLDRMPPMDQAWIDKHSN